MTIHCHCYCYYYYYYYCYCCCLFVQPPEIKNKMALKLGEKQKHFNSIDTHAPYHHRYHVVHLSDAMHESDWVLTRMNETWMTKQTAANKQRTCNTSSNESPTMACKAMATSMVVVHSGVSVTRTCNKWKCQWDTRPLARRLFLLCSCSSSLIQHTSANSPTCTTPDCGSKCTVNFGDDTSTAAKQRHNTHS